MWNGSTHAGGEVYSSIFALIIQEEPYDKHIRPAILEN